jgi:hypothetical protein
MKPPTKIFGDVEVTIRISEAAYLRAEEMIRETDPKTRRHYGLYEEMTVEEYLALLLEHELE